MQQYLQQRQFQISNVADTLCYVTLPYVISEKTDKGLGFIFFLSILLKDAQFITSCKVSNR